MTIGNGIAIAGVWVFAGLAAYSKTITSMGMWIAILIAIAVTIALK